MRVFGLVVTFCRNELLELTLERLGRQSRPIDHLVIVDNATDAECEKVAERVRGSFAEVSYLPSSRNLGPAGGIAAGMRWILDRADINDALVLLDDDDPPPDPYVIEDLLSSLSAVTRVDERAAGVAFGGARFDRRTSRLRQVKCGSQPVKVDYLKGNWFPTYRTRAVREIGVFREDFFFGFDDLEYGLRASESGWNVYVFDSAHRGRDSHLSQIAPRFRLNPWNWRRYYSLRNIVVLQRARGCYLSLTKLIVVVGLLKPIANFPLSPAESMRHLMGNARAIRDGLVRRMGLTILPGSDRRADRIGPPEVD